MKTFDFTPMDGCLSNYFDLVQRGLQPAVIDLYIYQA